MAKLYSKVARAVDWAIKIAKDDKCGYSQVRRTGPDYDCSSFVASALKAGGFNINPAAITTRNMDSALQSLGFSRMNYTPELSLQRGDIVLNELQHVLLMTDDCHCVSASSSETGGKDGQPGDQTGREIAVINFYNPSYGWESVYRWTNHGMDCMEDIFSFLPILKEGSRGEGVRMVQAILGYKTNDETFEVDGIFGPETKKKVIQVQRAWNLEVDGIVGKYTYQALAVKGCFVNHEF